MNNLYIFVCLLGKQKNPYCWGFSQKYLNKSERFCKRDLHVQ